MVALAECLNKEKGMAHYRMDNTEGYSQEELDKLNAVFERRTAHLDPDSPNYANEIDWYSDQVLIDYWQDRF